MKLNVPFWKRVEQLFCKHKIVGWSSVARGINSKEGCEHVTYECSRCGLSVSEWFVKGEWTKLDFPEEYTIQNKRKVIKRYFTIRN